MKTKIKTLVKLLVVLLLSLTFAFNTWAQKELYVSPDGNDSNVSIFNILDFGAKTGE